MLNTESVRQRPRCIMTLCWRRSEGGFELEVVDHVVEEVRLTDSDAHEAGVADVYLWARGVSLEPER